MTTRNEKLQSILDSRNACLSALISKGSTVTSATPFSEYAAAIRAIDGGGGGVLDNSDMVYAGNVAYICMKVTAGTVDIDWGDGTTETVQSSSSEQLLAHNYSTSGLYGVNLTSSSDASVSFGDYVYTSTGASSGKKSVLIIINRTPDGLTGLSGSCFQGCTSLASISLPDSLTGLSGSCFQGCTSLASISLPDSLTSLENYCFYDCSSLASISLPDGLTSIGTYCFCNCSSLTSVSLPDSLTSLEISCFRGCTSLASISLPDNLTSLENYCFYDCSSLASISLPDGLTSIGNNCFNYCKILETIYSKAITPPRLMTSSSLPGTSYVKNIYVPVGCADAYKSATNWSKYAGIISEMNVEDMP